MEEQKYPDYSPSPISPLHKRFKVSLPLDENVPSLSVNWLQTAKVSHSNEVSNSGTDGCSMSSCNAFCKSENNGPSTSGNNGCLKSESNNSDFVSEQDILSICEPVSTSETESNIFVKLTGYSNKKILTSPTTSQSLMKEESLNDEVIDETGVFNSMKAKGNNAILPDISCNNQKSLNNPQPGDNLTGIRIITGKENNESCTQVNYSPLNLEQKSDLDHFRKLDVYDLDDSDESNSIPTLKICKRGTLRPHKESMCNTSLSCSPTKPVNSATDTPDDFDKAKKDIKQIESNEFVSDCTNKPRNVSPPQKEVVYIHSDNYMEMCNDMVRVPGRACMVHRLIEAYGLLRYMKVVPPDDLKREDLQQFHSSDYISVLEKLNEVGEEGYDDQSQLCGIGYDCPALPGVFDYASLVAGATVTAADWLVQGKAKIAINWFGGWHHAKKDEASGFCYINDIVLGILKLKEKYQRVLYIDLDLHHGDGVEDAFSATSKVFTLSFHKYSAGFFPGSGSISDVGVGKGKYFTLNIPLLDGIRDDQFCGIFSRIAEKVRKVYCPEVIVCQCGADGLAGDPMNSFNLSHLSLGRCIHNLIQWDCPLLLLGGGGYDHANTARAWTFISCVALGKQVPVDIPDHQYFTEYGPSYELRVTPGNRKNLNTPPYLTQVFRTALGILQKTSQALALQNQISKS